MSGISTNSEGGNALHAYPLDALTRPLPSMMGLQAFVAVASLGSLTRAARQLCRTQGAVSRQIQQLEQHYQMMLFYRTPSGMSMSPDGEALYALATHLLGSLSAFSSRPREPQTSIRLRLPSTFALRWFLPRLDAIQQCLSGTHLEISTAVSDTPEFSNTEFDAMIVRGNGQWDGLHAELLFPEQLTPMCSPALAIDLHSPAEMETCRLIHANASRDEWQAWWRQFSTDSLPGQHLVFDSLEVATSAAVQGYGVVLGDPRLFQSQLSHGELVMPFPQFHSGEHGYYLVMPAQSDDLMNLRVLAETLHSLV
ncbi:LysR substrate-binding domain-containing protein [Vogesella sp. GCM10023246]|uniref:LysR substrate-binding domain-containing protein n=2 Tax=Chromobacteriaceae TaxID=1499392 RepID=A0ABV1M0K8_9NEIS